MFDVVGQKEREDNNNCYTGIYIIYMFFVFCSLKVTY